MKTLKTISLFILVFSISFISCDRDEVIEETADPIGEEITELEEEEEDKTSPGKFVGAVYAMSNGSGQIDGNVQGANSIVAYGRETNGKLTNIGTFATGGNGGDYDGGEGLDPLISAYAVTKTDDNKNLLVVNAGSNTITSFKILKNYKLKRIGRPVSTGAIGPNSIAYTPVTNPFLLKRGVKGVVYVSNITRPEFLDQGEPAQQGTITGYYLFKKGFLRPIRRSTRRLANRPSAIQFSPDGRFLAVTSINSGSAALASRNEDELVVYRTFTNGRVSNRPVSRATSTLRGNSENRNLPSAIGFQIVGDNYVVVTEAREFQADGTPPAFPALQDGSVSTWKIGRNGKLIPINLDVRSGVNNTGRTACWLDFTADGKTFFVSNAIEAGLASFSFDDGQVSLINQTAAQGTGTLGATTGPEAFANTDGWIDLWISDDGQFLYQLFGLDGTIGVYRINGQSLEFIEEITGDLPDTNTQGIVAI